MKAIANDAKLFETLNFVTFRLEHGASPQLQDSDGATALHKAAEQVPSRDFFYAHLSSWAVSKQIPGRPQSFKSLPTVTSHMFFICEVCEIGTSANRKILSSSFVSVDTKSSVLHHATDLHRKEMLCIGIHILSAKD